MINTKLLLKDEVKEILIHAIDYLFESDELFDKWATAKKSSEDVVNQYIEDQTEGAEDPDKDIKILAEDMMLVLPEKQKVTPSGRQIRSNFTNVVNKLKTWKKQWGKDKRFTDDIIVRATRMYGINAANRSYQQVSPLDFFIIKDRTSTLADYCEQILSGDGNEEETIAVKKKWKPQTI